MAAISRWLLPATIASSLVSAATVTYNFNITWVSANPDNTFERSVIGINGQWPIPTMRAEVGDQLIVNVHNQLGNESTSLHFHGLFMKGYNQMDGPSMVTQCEIPPGSHLTYNFTIQQPGTYWYHSHTHAQYGDGLRGPLIIHDPNSPYTGMYDEEVVLYVSDWYHQHISALVPRFMSKTNPSGAEPIPNAALINDTQDLKLHVEPGKTYLVRMVNLGVFASQYIWFEGHTMRIVEVDGVYTKEAEAEMIYLAVAQRCSFLLTTKNETGANYAFVGSMDTTLFDKPPTDLNYNVTGWLTYDDSKDFPDAATIDELSSFDDMDLVPYDEEALYPEPDRIITLNVVMQNLGDGANYAWFNNITYTKPKVPTLYTALDAGELATNPEVYGTWTNPHVLQKDEVVQIIVNNLDTGRHPFHLHGHQFQSIHRSEEEAGEFNESAADFPVTPIRRDTLVLQPKGNMVLRFKADNPGIWLFHCHIEWHIVSGLVATMIEAPLELQDTITVPTDHIEACKAGGVAHEGNAAANTKNYLDLSGQNVPPKPLPAGFTTRGIIAFVFSCAAGILGTCVIAWYGFAEVRDSAYDAAADQIAATDTGAPSLEENHSGEPVVTATGGTSAEVETVLRR